MEQSLPPVLDTRLTFDHLRAVNLARCEGGFRHSLSSWSPSQWLVAVGGEVGEALNVVKKMNRLSGGLGQFRDVDVEHQKTKLGAELADVVIYLDLLMARFGLSLSRAAQLCPAINRPVPGQALDDFRAAIWSTMGFVADVTDAGADLLSSSGKLAHDVICESVDRCDIEPGEPMDDDYAGEIYEHAGAVLHDCDCLALAAGIDLGAAIIATFNAKSAELGVPHMLSEVTP